MDTKDKVSSCHQKSLQVATSDEGTNHYVCSECHQACDAITGKPDTSGIQTSSDIMG